MLVGTSEPATLSIQREATGDHLQTICIVGYQTLIKKKKSWISDESLCQDNLSVHVPSLTHIQTNHGE